MNGPELLGLLALVLARSGTRGGHRDRMARPAKGEQLVYGSGVSPRLQSRAAPSPIRLALVALAGLLAGLVLVRLTLSAPSHRDGEELVEDGDGFGDVPANADDDEREASEGGEPGDRDLVDEATEDENEEELVDEEELVAEEESEEVSEEVSEELDPAATGAARPLPTTPTSRRFERGRLAYLRCGALADANGRCPRDRDLEASVWELLEAVSTRCGIGAGQADARYAFAPGQAPALSLFDLGRRDSDVTAIESEPLLACLEPYSANLTTTLRGEFILSVRFQVR